MRIWGWITGGVWDYVQECNWDCGNTAGAISGTATTAVGGLIVVGRTAGGRLSTNTGLSVDGCWNCPRGTSGDTAGIWYDARTAGTDTRVPACGWSEVSVWDWDGLDDCPVAVFNNWQDGGLAAPEHFTNTGWSCTNNHNSCNHRAITLSLHYYRTTKPHWTGMVDVHLPKHSTQWTAFIRWQLCKIASREVSNLKDDCAEMTCFFTF